LQFLLKMTQAQKIIEMCKGGDWVCQASFWKAYIFSPHKRRDDIKKIKERGIQIYDFAGRPCIHGIERSKDFKLIRYPSQGHYFKLTKVSYCI
jgi:hypothetical protein